MAGIYLHIPFCKQACYYCDFHFSTDQSHKDELTNAMVKEISIRKGYIQGSLSTVYFGGGTPSVLNENQLGLLMESIHKNFQVDKNAEITLEANPDDLSIERLNMLRKFGINRLSIGIQSFDDHTLKFLNRAHNGVAARNVLHDVRSAGFKNVSIDLIYAIPDLDEKKWAETLCEALSFSPEHISSYSLTIEEHTVFGNWSKRGKFHRVGDELAAAQFEMLMDTLTGHGYEHYEISNFGKPGFYSRHNTSYWKGTHYLGVGPGAHSFDGASRQFNVRNNAVYVRSLAEGKIPFESEVLSRGNKINEYIMTTLRTKWGCNLNHLKEAFDEDLMIRSEKYLSVLKEEGLATIEDSALILTRKGKLLADKIAEDLMVEEG